MSSSIVSSSFTHVVSNGRISSCSRWINIPLYGSTPHFLHPVICPWAFGLFPPVGYCEQWCNECGGWDISLGSWLHLLWIYNQRWAWARQFWSPSALTEPLAADICRCDELLPLDIWKPQSLHTQGKKQVCPTYLVSAPLSYAALVTGIRGGKQSP